MHRKTANVQYEHNMCHQCVMLSLINIWSKCRILCCSLHWCITWESLETSVSCSSALVQEAWRIPLDRGVDACYHLVPVTHNTYAHTNTNTNTIKGWDSTGACYLAPFHLRTQRTTGHLGIEQEIRQSSVFNLTGFTTDCLEKMMCCIWIYSNE